MANKISDRAVIGPEVKMGDDVTIGPFVFIAGNVVIGDHVTIYSNVSMSGKIIIGDHCTLFPNVSVMSGTQLGSDNIICQNTVLGALPQDFSFKGEETELIIGNHNIFRENIVINRASHTGGQTVIGNHNFLMEGTHISHDTKIGDKCVFGYGTKIAGDCQIADRVIFSSSVIENGGTRVGEGSMIQAGSTFSKDIPPYVIAGGNPARYNGINSVMMTSYGVEQKVQNHIANAYRLVFHGQNSILDAVLQIKNQVPDGPQIRNIVDFINASQLGIIGKTW
ncbi:MAG: acyl-ACP--UDP-N-acetylglucosamine O-acyltransferase [Prevotella sp.]|jgi:UDP-N-acetylglucosamine acyltransferase|nr:acyl-ACP--UDP-N-acetylglucosamine O-acyltransferase [Prevotella sp.]MCH3970737.1 acyl-ACP--UDP-N-acetylglucosamine O-acyltransferase [Prevotella sp.]MCH3984889.1 acyl-ACP--UDP-N-acetylglucosamine O-acyltransferase [Prevotella sp.]MCH3991452.1 acyl-ACP--UDP-N-acetylglucosamine O-acyltransferase [Prevotella sp.]MCH4186833.1 acyl-ACP--UDP-N-acetylglucosamine O-acyltransferase [Prevotella sp.]MCH4216140.1 acyl-ACP--UDP-N-acetylglucosamine O-acyltransferase [Prevotella sp.]